jgi:hypothetical protein
VTKRVVGVFFVTFFVKDSLLKTSLVGKVNIPFEPAAFEALYKK